MLIIKGHKWVKGREKESHKKQRERERERQREKWGLPRACVLPKAGPVLTQSGAWAHKLWDHDLSQSQMLNDWATQVPKRERKVGSFKWASSSPEAGLKLTWYGTQTHELWDHDLSQSQMLNDWATQTSPFSYFLLIRFIYLFLMYWVLSLFLLFLFSNEINQGY